MIYSSPACPGLLKLAGPEPASCQCEAALPVFKIKAAGEADHPGPCEDVSRVTAADLRGCRRDRDGHGRRAALESPSLARRRPPWARGVG